VDFASVEEAKAVIDKQEDIVVDDHVLYVTYKSELEGKGKTKEMHSQHITSKYVYTNNPVSISHIHGEMKNKKTIYGLQQMILHARTHAHNIHATHTCSYS